MDIGDVDVTSIDPGTGASNLGKAEDAAHSSGDTGVMSLAVRNDTLAALAGTDGDYAPIQVDASGAVYVQEGSALDVSAATVTTTPAVTGGGTESAAQRVTIANDSTGVLSVDDNGGSLTVDGTVTANAGTGTFNVQEASALDVSAATVTTTDASIATEGSALGSGVLLQGDDGTDRKNVAVDATSGNVQADIASALPAGTNAIGKLAANSGVDIGDVDVTSIAAGSNLIGDVGIGVRTSGGTSIFRSLDLDESEQEVKGSAGQLYWIHAMNLSSGTLFLKVYNAAAASVTVGTTTPVLTFPLATPGDTNGAGFTFSIPNGIEMDTGITVACTTGIADNDTGAPGANECVVNIGYG